jgi:hypothetical protein
MLLPHPVPFAIASAAVIALTTAPSQAFGRLFPDESDLAAAHCQALRDGANPGNAFVYAMQTNAYELDLQITRQRSRVQTARIQLSAVENGGFGYSRFNGTRGVIEEQIARAASGAPPGLTVQQATRNYWDAKEMAMLLSQRAARWALAMRHELQRFQAGATISKRPELYSEHLAILCPELIK